MCMWIAPRSADRPFAEWNLSVEGEEEGSESEEEKELPNEPGPATEASLLYPVWNSLPADPQSRWTLKGNPAAGL